MAPGIKEHVADDGEEKRACSYI